MSSRNDEFAQAHRLYGSHNLDALFPDRAPMAPAPWPRASRRKRQKDVDEARIKEALESAPRLQEYDPRTIHSTQPNVVRSHTQYYMGDEYEKTGRTAADQGNAGNRYPVVYEREGGQNLLLSGHHRAAAALLQGRQFRARVIEGPWGHTY